VRRVVDFLEIWGSDWEEGRFDSLGRGVASYLVPDLRMSVSYLWSVEWETVALAIVGCPHSDVEEWGKEGEQR
jgi:hypothetical protein